MLYDRRWEIPPPTLPPTKPKPKIITEPWRQILLDAADLIEEKGWIQGTFYKRGEGYCIFGALTKVASKHDNSQSHLRAAQHQLQRHKSRRSIMRWNDADGRSKEEVLTALRTVALS
jgi:hypothetical protein